SHFSPVFFHATASTISYTLSLHDALPICFTSIADRPRAVRLLARSAISSETLAALDRRRRASPQGAGLGCLRRLHVGGRPAHARSEEHTSELQSRENLVCRLLLEKKKSTE